MRIRAMKKQSQNKPNFRKAKMNVNLYVIEDYENKPRFPAPGKQTQSNPMSKIKAGGELKSSRDSFRRALRKINFVVGGAKIGFSIVEAVTVDVVDEKMVGRVDNLSVHLNTDSLFPNPRESAGIISVCTPVYVPFAFI